MPLSTARRRWRKTYDPRWSVWAAGFGGSQTTDGNTALGSNTTTSRLFGIAAGADYCLLAQHRRRLCAGRRRHQFQRQWFGSGRSDLFQAGAFVRHTAGAAYVTAALAYGWQDVTTDRTVTIAGVDRLRAQFNANACSGRVEGGYRFVTPWMGGVGITPYAAGQFTTFDLPAYAEQVVSGANTFALAYGSKSVTDDPQRTRPARRQILRDAERGPDAARPRRLGARLQSRPRRRRHLPDAARRELRRQRRAAGQRLRADHGIGRNEMAERLVGRRPPSKASSPTSPAAMPARASRDTLGGAFRVHTHRSTTTSRYALRLAPARQSHSGNVRWTFGTVWRWSQFLPRDAPDQDRCLPITKRGL